MNDDLVQNLIEVMKFILTSIKRANAGSFSDAIDEAGKAEEVLAKIVAPWKSIDGK